MLHIVRFYSISYLNIVNCSKMTRFVQTHCVFTFFLLIKEKIHNFYIENLQYKNRSQAIRTK